MKLNIEQIKKLRANIMEKYLEYAETHYLNINEAYEERVANIYKKLTFELLAYAGRNDRF
tara:strand:+ start:147 stop:326 length:180 start_codon:yes stop_codon:yes gene_type:complete